MSSERAVLRLITSSNSVGRSIAKSPGREVAALDKAEFAQALAEPGGRVRVRPRRRGAEREHADPGHGGGRLRAQQGDTSRQTTGGDELEQAAAVHSISLFARSIRGRAVVAWARLSVDRRFKANAVMAKQVRRLRSQFIVFSLLAKSQSPPDRRVCADPGFSQAVRMVERSGGTRDHPHACARLRNGSVRCRPRQFAGMRIAKRASTLTRHGLPRLQRLPARQTADGPAIVIGLLIVAGPRRITETGAARMRRCAAWCSASETAGPPPQRRAPSCPATSPVRGQTRRTASVVVR